MKDKQARKAIESLRDAVSRLGHNIGIEIKHWPVRDEYWVLKEAWLYQEQQESGEYHRELKECIKKLNALMDALGFEFERRPAELIAKKKSEK